MKCSTKKCHGNGDIIVVGKYMCWDCWSKYCKDKED